MSLYEDICNPPPPHKAALSNAAPSGTCTNTLCSDTHVHFSPINRLCKLLERYSKDPGSSPGGDACFSH